MTAAADIPANPVPNPAPIPAIRQTKIFSIIIRLNVLKTFKVENSNKSVSRQDKCLTFLISQ